MHEARDSAAPYTIYICIYTTVYIYIIYIYLYLCISIVDVSFAAVAAFFLLVVG